MKNGDGEFNNFIINKNVNFCMRKDGLVGYDAAFTRLRSRVRFPVFVLFVASDVFHLRE